MYIQQQTTEGIYRVSMTEERTSSRWGSLVFSVVLSLVLVGYLMHLAIGWWVLPTVFVLATFTLYPSIRNLFSVSTLEVTEDELRLIRSLFFFSRKRSFSKNDVEWIGFSPEISVGRDHQDSGLSIMVRSDVTPVMFARTITTSEASTVFDGLKTETPWLASKIKPIGAQLF